MKLQQSIIDGQSGIAGQRSSGQLIITAQAAPLELLPTLRLHWRRNQK